MAYKTSIEVKTDDGVALIYRLRYREPVSFGGWVEKEIDYETAMIILGAIEQGREEAKGALRRALGVK
jgi:hypothetical protein